MAKRPGNLCARSTQIHACACGEAVWCFSCRLLIDRYIDLFLCRLPADSQTNKRSKKKERTQEKTSGSEKQTTCEHAKHARRRWPTSVHSHPGRGSSAGAPGRMGKLLHEPCAETQRKDLHMVRTISLGFKPTSSFFGEQPAWSLKITRPTHKTHARAPDSVRRVRHDAVVHLHDTKVPAVDGIV